MTGPDTVCMREPVWAMRQGEPGWYGVVVAAVKGALMLAGWPTGGLLKRPWPVQQGWMLRAIRYKIGTSPGSADDCR